MPSGLQIRATRSENRYLLSLEGELDLLAVDVLRGHFETLAWANFPRLVVDLRGLTFIDSTGLGEVVWILRKARAAGKKLEMIPGPSSVQRVFGLAGILDMFEWIEPPDADC